MHDEAHKRCGGVQVGNAWKGCNPHDHPDGDPAVSHDSNMKIRKMKQYRFFEEYDKKGRSCEKQNLESNAYMRSSSLLKLIFDLVPVAPSPIEMRVGS